MQVLRLPPLADNKPETLSRHVVELNKRLDTIAQALEERQSKLTLTGDLDAGGFRIKNVGTAQSENDSLSPVQMDGILQGLDEEFLAAVTSEGAEEGVGGSNRLFRRGTSRFRRETDDAITQSLIDALPTAAPPNVAAVSFIGTTFDPPHFSLQDHTHGGVLGAPPAGGVAGQVAFFTSSFEIGGDPGMTYDAALNGLTVAGYVLTPTVYGSAVTGGGLTLIPNTADATGKIGLFDPAQAFFTRNDFGTPSLIIGSVDPTPDLLGMAAANIAIYDENSCVFAMRSDTNSPKYIMMSFADAADAPFIGSFRGRGGSFATRTQPNAGDGLFVIGAFSFKANGDFMDDSAGGFGYETDGVFTDWVSARLGFSIMFDDGVRRHPLYLFPDSLVVLGNELPDITIRPTDRTLQVQSLETDRITAVFLAVASQTANLSEWHDAADAVVASVGLTGNITLAAVGSELLIKEGTNASMGRAVLVGGTVVVGNTLVTAVSEIFVTSQVDGGVPGAVRVSARTVGTDFTITSTNPLDTSTVAWVLIEPAP